MKEREIGHVSNYFSKLSVAAINITDGTIKVGDTIHFKGSVTDFEERVESMQIDRSPVDIAQSGDSIGLKVSQKVRRKDKLFKVLEE
jgi:putative protease